MADRVKCLPREAVGAEAVKPWGREVSKGECEVSVGRGEVRVRGGEGEVKKHAV